MQTDEEKKELGKKELEILGMMFERWIKADFNWALEYINKNGSTGEDEEWDFLRRDWIDKLESWIGPWVRRLYETGYITGEDVDEFGEMAAETITTALNALYTIGGNNRNE